MRLRRLIKALADASRSLLGEFGITYTTSGLSNTKRPLQLKRAFRVFGFGLRGRRAWFGRALLRRSGSLHLEGADVGASAHDAGQAALVGAACDARIAGVDGGASRHQSHGKSRPAVVFENREAVAIGFKARALS
jgi:hypothetical protein